MNETENYSIGKQIRTTSGSMGFRKSQILFVRKESIFKYEPSSIRTTNKKTDAINIVQDYHGCKTD